MKLKLIGVSLTAFFVALGSTALAAGTNEPIRGEVRNVPLPGPQVAADKPAPKAAPKKVKAPKKKKTRKAKKVKKAGKVKVTPAGKAGTAKSL